MTLTWWKNQNWFLLKLPWCQSKIQTSFWLKFWLDWLKILISKLLDSTRLDSQWLGWLVTRTISDSIHPYWRAIVFDYLAYIIVINSLLFISSTLNDLLVNSGYFLFAFWLYLGPVCNPYYADWSCSVVIIILLVFLAWSEKAHRPPKKP